MSDKMTVIVAASDTGDKMTADYICDGMADEVEINRALLMAKRICPVIMLPGTYHIDTAVSLFDPADDGNGASNDKIDSDLDYAVVSARTVSRLEYLVKEGIQTGWKPLGGIATLQMMGTEPIQDSFRFYQAMIRERAAT